MLALWKAMTNLDSILKSRDITDKGLSSQSSVCSVVMYECKSWTIKKAECQRINAFKCVVLEKTPESPMDCKEIKPFSRKQNQS